MPKLKQYLTESEITDDLKGAYTLGADGRYKLNDLSDDHTLIVAQTEVNTKAEARQQQIDALTASVGNLERERDEYKAKAIPQGFRAVKAKIAELGEAAENAGYTKEEIQTLKTQAAELQQQIDGLKSEKVIETVAGVKNFNNRFKIAAREKGLQFENATEKVDGKDVEKWFVVGSEGAKTDLDEFLKTDEYFKEFADTFQTQNAQPPKFGNSPDPKPIGAATDTEKENAAKAAQARTTLASF